MARHLSDTLVIPLDVVNFANVLEKLVKTLEKDYGEFLRNNSIDFGEWGHPFIPFYITAFGQDKDFQITGILFY